MAMAKVICEEEVGGETVIRSYTTTTNGAAAFVKVRPGVGKKFWCWPAVPAGTIIGADFTSAPTATATTLDNQTHIDAITAQPADVLVYA
jgi:hypothetical protein